MKLFLTSQWLLPAFRPAFEHLVGKPLKHTHVALIENGADTSPGQPRWVKRARDSLVDAGITVTLLDLRECRGEKGQNELRQVLGVADVVWIGGGNIFYLNWLLKDTGARDIIIEYAKNGNVVAGGSAGAIVAGPTIETFEAADDASAAPSVICDALALTATVVLPHWGREDYGSAMERIAKQLTARSYVVQPLTDREALVINGSSRRIVGA